MPGQAAGGGTDAIDHEQSGGTMLAAHIGAVLAVTGIITALPVVLFAAPAQRCVSY